MYGGLVLLATLFGLFPYLEKLFADSRFKSGARNQRYLQALAARIPLITPQWTQLATNQLTRDLGS